MIVRVITGRDTDTDAVFEAVAAAYADPKVTTVVVHEAARLAPRGRDGGHGGPLGEARARGGLLMDTAPLPRTSGLYDHEGSPMHGWPLLRRETRLLEATCEHGVGHPIPESVAWMDQHGPVGARGAWDVHGCDGCCRKAA